MIDLQTYTFRVKIFAGNEYLYSNFISHSTTVDEVFDLLIEFKNEKVCNCLYLLKDKEFIEECSKFGHLFNEFISNIRELCIKYPDGTMEVTYE